LSGAKIIVYPSKDAGFIPEENIIIGNVAFYGATSGEAFVRGKAGERFCVRNSGANVVVEGVGDHGCEYMTGGRAIILGATGRNFAAGMSGGIAYVYDVNHNFDILCNREMVDLDPVDNSDEKFLQEMIRKQFELTGSTVARFILNDFENQLKNFVKVFPQDYKKVLQASTVKESVKVN
jgi:glutamate synthase (NADPH) large chain